MPTHVLITGGAGFIGSHVADLLLARGFTVRILDNLIPQVHGETERPPYLTEHAELISATSAIVMCSAAPLSEWAP
jgi:dTDP-L-rhamnose 4-epimerase